MYYISSIEMYSIPWCPIWGTDFWPINNDN
jgi:hypothetical protein